MENYGETQEQREKRIEAFWWGVRRRRAGFLPPIQSIKNGPFIVSSFAFMNKHEQAGWMAGA